MLEVLHTLTLKGLAFPADLSGSTGLAEPDITELLTGWAERGLVRERTGRMSGWSVTPYGRAERDAWLAANPAGPELADGYASFLPLNSAFKALCTRWQQRPDDSDIQFAVDGVTAIHAEVVPVIGKLGMERFTLYVPRLGAALQRFGGGDLKALTFPRSGSYHDIWMELHADLLATLGRERSAADES